MYAASDLTWTLVRPPRLVDGEATGRLEHHAHRSTRSTKITRAALGACYRRHAARRGKGNAVVAIQHTILVTIWSMAQTGARYGDRGADHYTRIQPLRTNRHAIRQLEEFGYTVTLQPTS